MKTGVWPNHFLLNVCTFLPLHETLLSLSLTSSSLSRKIHSLLPILLRLHIANGDHSLLSFDTPQLKSFLTSPPCLLKFSPLYFNGGVSYLEVETSFEAMWEYSGSTYSTMYARSPAPLVTNRICSAYFAGVEGENCMTKRFHYDVNLLVNHADMVDLAMHETLKTDHETALTVDFVFDSLNSGMTDICGMLMDDEEWDRRVSEQREKTEADVMEKRYAYQPEGKGVAIVREVAVARPLNFTGPVKTMMIFAGRRPGSEYSPEEFKKWEDIDTLEKAASVDRSTPIRSVEGVLVVEYEPGPGDYYPLLWVYFPDPVHNHVRVPLSRPHTFSQTTVMMYSIEDMRERYQLSENQPNFDIMFVVFLGSVASPKEDPKEE